MVGKSNKIFIINIFKLNKITKYNICFQSNFCPLCKFELKTDNEMYELYKEEMKNRQTREDNIAQLHDSMFS